MRLWLKDSERRPDPEPAQTDDRKAILVGLAGWVIALIVLLVAGPLIDGWSTEWLVTCGAGLLLGVAALVYTVRRHGR